GQPQGARGGEGLGGAEADVAVVDDRVVEVERPRLEGVPRGRVGGLEVGDGDLRDEVAGDAQVDAGAHAGVEAHERAVLGLTDPAHRGGDAAGVVTGQRVLRHGEREGDDGAGLRLELDTVLHVDPGAGGLGGDVGGEEVEGAVGPDD